MKTTVKRVIAAAAMAGFLMGAGATAAMAATSSASCPGATAIEYGACN